MKQTIPAPHPHSFTNGIQHPDLYLWDAWSYYKNDAFHLYTLAVCRKNDDGTSLKPSERNSVPFHIRHFSSRDEGTTWKDEGCFLTPRLGEGKADSKSVWSGSIELLPSGEKLVAYTGLYDVDEDHNFVQNIMLANSDGYQIQARAEEPVSCSRRDWNEITEKGYYLAPLEDLGQNDGESGGPVLAWRDPYIFLDQENNVHLFWGAKIGPKLSAMAHALLRRNGQLYDLEELYPPTTMPDGEGFTQLELPKIIYNKNEKTFYLIISTCNRLYEGQSDDEVDKTVRLYKSQSLNGPWEMWGKKGSAILWQENLFGLTVLKTDFEKKRLLCVAPYTDAAEERLSMTFSPVFYINLDPVDVIFSAP